MATIRLLVADDHEVIRRGVRSLLGTQPGWEVSGEAASGREAVEKAKQLKPDLVVLDLGEEREMWQWTSASPLDRPSAFNRISGALAGLVRRFAVRIQNVVPTCRASETERVVIPVGGFRQRTGKSSSTTSDCSCAPGSESSLRRAG